MKTIKIFYLLNDNLTKNENAKLLAKSLKQFVKTFSNSLLEYDEIIDDNKIRYKFYSHYNTKIVGVEAIFYPLIIHKEIEWIKEIVSLAINKAYDFIIYNQNDQQPIDLDNTNKISEVILGTFNKYSSIHFSEFLTPEFIKTKNMFNIIDLVNEIFVNLLLDHILINGNKRLALTILSRILYVFGFYLKYSNYQDENFFIFMDEIEEIIKIHQEKQDIEKTKEKSKKFIMDNIFIALNFYKK